MGRMIIELASLAMHLDCCSFKCLFGLKTNSKNCLFEVNGGILSSFILKRVLYPVFILFYH